MKGSRRLEGRYRSVNHEKHPWREIAEELKMGRECQGSRPGNDYGTDKGKCNVMHEHMLSEKRVRQRT